MSSKKFLLPLAIILTIILGVLFGVADWYKNYVREKMFATQQLPLEEKINEQRESQNKTLVFLEKPDKIHLIEIGSDRGEVKDSIIPILLAPIVNTEKITVVNDILYFVGKDENGKRALKSLNLKSSKENFQSLDFIDAYNLDFLISPDNKKMAWVILEPIKIVGEKPHIKRILPAKIFSTDTNNMDRKNKEIIFQKDYDGYYYPSLVSWPKNKKIYFLESPDGLGMTSGRPGFLFELNLKSGEINKVVGEENGGYITFIDFSDDGTMLAYRIQERIIIKNLITEKMITLIGKNVLGNIYVPSKFFFSPTNRFLAYEFPIYEHDESSVEPSVWPKENIVFVVDSATLEKKEILKGLYYPDGWLDEERLIVHNQNGKTYLINKDGAGLTEISDLAFLGVME